MKILITIALLSMGMNCLGFSTWITSETNKFDSIFPNLSIETTDQGPIFNVPSRAQRMEFWDKTEVSVDSDFLELNRKDELDQDLYFWKKLKQHKLRDHQYTPEIESSKVSEANSPQDPSKKSVVFFDLNFAPAEIRAAREAAIERGENFILIPNRTAAQQNEIENLYRITLLLQEKFIACFRSKKDCSVLEKQRQEANEKLSLLVAQIQHIENVEKIFEKLEAEGVRPSVFIFSGHSGGGGGFIGGLFGQLSAEELSGAFKKHPRLKSVAKSVLLWGCYTGTLASLANTWQKIFPESKTIVGYRNRAPLGIRPSSGKLLKGFLLKEAELQGASSMAAAHQIFKTIDFVGELDATAVLGEIFMSYDQVAKVSDLIKICDQFDEAMLTKYSCYNQGKEGCENPPKDHLGPLRNFYSYLQINRHCEEVLRSKYPMMPSVDAVVRLIFVDNIKINFANHYKSEFEIFAEHLRRMNLSTDLGLSAYLRSNRSDDNKRLKQLNYELEKKGISDGSFLKSSEWKSISLVAIENWGLQSILGLGIFYFGPCVPFSWIEEGSKENDLCQFGKHLSLPLTEFAEQNILLDSYIKRLDSWIADSVYPGLWDFNYTDRITLEKILEVYLLHLRTHLDWLEKTSFKSEVINQRLKRYRQEITDTKSWSPQQVLEKLIFDFKKTLLIIQEFREAAKKDKYGQMADYRLGQIERTFQSTQLKLQKLK